MCVYMLIASEILEVSYVCMNVAELEERLNPRYKWGNELEPK